MNSLLGDSHHHQEFIWLNGIRCAENKISGLSESHFGAQASFPVLVTPPRPRQIISRCLQSWAMLFSPTLMDLSVLHSILLFT